MCFRKGMTLFLSVLLSLSALVFAGRLSAHEWGEVTEEEWLTGAPAEYPEANALILFKNGILSVSQDNIRLEFHIRIKVLNEAGIDEVGDMGISYREDDHLKKVEAQTFTPEGKKQEIGRRDFHTQTAGSYKRKTFALPAVDSGCIIEYKYTLAHERYGELDPWFFQDNRFYTLQSEFTLVLSPGFTYSTASLNIPTAEQQAEVEEWLNPDDYSLPLTAYRWTMENLPPIKDEPYMRHPDNYRAALYNQLVSYKSPRYSTSFIKGWSDLGSQLQDIYELDYIDVRDHKVNKGELIEHLVDSLTAGSTDDRERARAIYDYVCSEIETSSMGGSSVSKVNDNLGQLLTLKSGSSDEKNMLLREMYREADIPAWMVLIGTRDEKVFMPDLYQMHQFNHIIVMIEIDSTRMYLDACSPYCPFGFLPPPSRVRGGCLLDGANSQIIGIDSPDPRTYRYDNTHIRISRDGPAACSTHIAFHGYFAHLFGELHDRETDEELISEMFLDDLDIAYEIDTIIIRRDEPGVLDMIFSYTLPDYGRLLGNNLAVKPVRYYFRENPFGSDRRYAPIDFNYPFYCQNKVEIEFDEGLTSYTVPDPIDLQMPGCSFARKCMFDGSRVYVTSQLEFEKPMYSHEDYGWLRNFAIQVASSLEDDIVLTY